MKNVLFIALLSTNSLFAQITSQDFYSFRMNNMVNVNPAYSNYSDGINVYFGGVSQTKGVNFNTKNLTAGAYSRVSAKQGIGVNMITDVRGAFQTTKATFSYAYSAKFSEIANITFGLNAGIANYGLNQNRIEGVQYLDQTDPTLDANYYNGTQFIAGAGILFRWKELEASLSLPHVVQSNATANPYFHSLLEYRIKTKNSFTIAPSVVYQNIPVLGSVYAGYLKGSYKDLIWLKGGYQSNQAIHMIAGFNVENIGLGYGYRINNSRFNTVAHGVHELTLSIKINTKKNRTIFNPTLVEIDHRLTKLQSKRITAKNKQEVIDEVKEIKRLMENTEINNSTPEASEEAAEYFKKIEQKLIELQTRINESL